MKITSSLVKKMMTREGIDLVGIADARSLVLAYPPRPAAHLMPSARSVIVFAVAHSLGSVYSPDIMVWTRNKMQTSRILDAAAEKIGRFLEREGFLSMPVSADKPVEVHKFNPHTNKKFSQPKVVAQLSHKHAAVSCGMGEIGDNNMLLTPEFGPHQRLCAIITEAVLEPDLKKEIPLCGHCGKCREACPSGALGDSGYSVDPCFNYWTYGFKRVSPKRFWQWPGFIRMVAKHNKFRSLPVELGQTMITDVDNCIECMRACPVGSRWKKIRPREMVPQRSQGTFL
ncbi:MAG: hypothetical protein GY754_41675 [bacterium]|nr:hypothetical protein [bacterium]